MDTNVVTGLVPVEETTQFLVAEATQSEGEAQKENAPEFTALEASVAFATVGSTSEYSTEPTACQVSASPFFALAQNDITLAEIEAAIAVAARRRIESAHRDLAETRERIERERAAREHTLEAAQERVSQTQSALDGLADERAALENRARAFLGGEELQAMQGKIHLAFNARQLDLEDALALAKTDEADAREEIQAANLTDALELQLAEQELERLETAAPETAQAIQQAESVLQIIAAARQSLKDGFLRDAAALIVQAKAANADSCGIAQDKSAEIAEVELALAEAKQAQLAQDLIARVKTNGEQPGAMKRIRDLMQEAEVAGIADQVAPYAERAWQIARGAANTRFGQARPIADHLAKEGFVPVVGDGRIEAWKKMSHNGTSGADHQSTWELDHILTLRGNAGWATEQPRVPITRKTLSPHVMRSRWYRMWASSQNAVPQPDAASD